MLQTVTGENDVSILTTRSPKLARVAWGVLRMGKASYTISSRSRRQPSPSTLVRD